MRRQEGSYRLKFIALFLGMGLYSCNDFLDENPDNRVALDNLDQAAQLLVNAYSIASPNFTDWMSDDVQFTIGTSQRLSHQQMYAWEDVTTGPTEQDSPDFYWFETYNSIAHANEVLALLEEIEVSSEDEVRRDAIKGEALLVRAYGHFMLVNMFGEHFGASAGRGIPYIREPETTFLAEYERLSVRRVYDRVEDDMLEGLELINDTFFENSGKYHFNKNAALAFASRFYLFQGNFTLCKQYSDQLLGSNPGAFVRDLTSQEFNIAGASITEYPRLWGAPDQPANLLLMRKISLVQRPDFAYGSDQTFYNALFGSSLFGALTDERQNPALVKGFNAVYPLRYQSLFERSSLNSNVGFPYYIHMAFTGEEVLLNRVEANAHLGDFDASIADLQVLSERRFSGGAPVITLASLRDFYNNPNNDLNNILLYLLFLERRKEFIFQGMRWWDIKRYGLAVTHDLADGSTIRLEATDLRKVLQIPQSAIDVGGLRPNPR